MATIASFSTTFCCTRTESTRLFTRFSPSTHCPLRLHSRVSVMARLNSSNSVSPAGSSNDNDNDNKDERESESESEHVVHDGVYLQGQHAGSPVFVKLPVDTAGSDGKVRRRKTIAHSLNALAKAGVEGVVVEVWWGIVERESPGVYDWRAYVDLIGLASNYGLKVRALLAFHQCGTGPGDPKWISLPIWVLEEMKKDPDIAYCDRFGRRNMEYISLGCDFLPVLRGRSPIQAYADFMRNFRDTFKPFLGVVISGIQVSMGPSGELRYPLCPPQKLTSGWRLDEFGEFQCYDKYMIASLNACACEIGMREWGDGGPPRSSSSTQDPELTEFFRSNNEGSWNTAYGSFFLLWYSGMLILHGERLCTEAESIFHGTNVNMSAKMGRIYWHYDATSHPSELTAGYFNTSTRDGFLPIARVFSKYGFIMCCSGFELQDSDEKRTNPFSSPEGFLRQLLLAARMYDVPFEGENSTTGLNDAAFKQVLKMSKYYTDGRSRSAFSFNFSRMDKHMFEYQNWVRFTRFVRQMSDTSIFRSRLDFRVGGGRLSSTLDSARVGILH